MRMRENCMREFARLPLLILPLAVLTACGPRDPAALEGLPPALLPNYGLGDSYQFTDGTQQTVVAVDGNVVHWRGNDGTFATSRDVLLPRLSWTDATTEGQRQ